MAIRSVFAFNVFLRSLFAFLGLPAVVGGLIPWLLYSNSDSRMHGTPAGWPLLVLGACVLLWGVRDFYVIGRGTLGPWDPPKRLVIVGLYRFVRNPMYLGLLGWVGGWSLVTGSRTLMTYTVILGLGFHLRVLFYEEPTLARLFPDDWPRYRSRVNRWLPKKP